MSLVVVGVVAIGIAALFWWLGTEGGDRISSGIGAGAGLIAVVLGLSALRTKTGRERGAASAIGAADREPPLHDVTMHIHAEGEGQINALGQGVQHIDQRRNDR
jgi:hypothetical protein